MCRICEKLNVDSLAAAYPDQIQMGGGDYSKLINAFPFDGVGDFKAPAITPRFLITTDNVPDAPDTAGNTNPVLAVTGPGVTTPIVSTIDVIGDRDFYKVTLEAGKTYEIGLYSFNGGPNAAGLTDPFMELYAADGRTLIVSADGGANTPYNQANSGFDVLLTYTPQVSGTYYINARAYSNSAATPNGDSVGDYQLFAREQDPNDPSVYRPYYDVDNPLYSLDWGSQVDGTVRNPDGNEGTRNTGNAAGIPDNKGEAFGHNGQSTEGKNVIKIYFAKAGDVYTPEDPTSPGLPPAIVAVGAKDFEIEAVWVALGEFEKVADVVYVETQNREEADFHYVTYSGTPGPGVSLLGSMSPPNESDEGLAQFNSGDARWNATNLAQGGFSFVTLIHEFGHGHGMSHPHDNGGRSGVMRGVAAEGPAFDYTTGDFDLNQGVFTMMSYEDGWQKSPYGNAPTNVGYGYLGGLMAFDIAVIQDKYGVNEEWATGDNTYTLKDENAAGTFYYSIWDAGGNDTIVYEGAKNTTIDLREATLKYEVGGGGFMSYAHGIFGGFTIAKGAVIENATSGAGNDTLVGNAANNVLNSGAGKDLIRADLGGDDTVLAGDGDDFIYFGNALTSGDSIDGGAGTDTLGLIGNYDMTFGANHLVGIERLAVYSNSATVGTASYNLTTIDANVGTGGLFVTAASLKSTETLTFNGSAETDGAFRIQGGAGNDSIAGGAKGDYLIGNAGNDLLFGLGGNDTLVGGAGADQLRGGAGADTFRFTSTADSNSAGGIDRILDFQEIDQIDLTAIDAIAGTPGNEAFTFIGQAAFSGAGQLRATFDSAGGFWLVEGDTNGDNVADFQLQVVSVGNTPIIAADFLL